MSLIVFEPDMLVRTDICESLALEFPHHPVELVETLDAVRTGTASVVVVSLPDGTTQVDVAALLGGTKHRGAVVIANAPRDRYELPENSAYVQRPFSSDALLSAVRSVLSAQPVRLS